MKKKVKNKGPFEFSFSIIGWISILLFGVPVVWQLFNDPDKSFVTIFVICIIIIGAWLIGMTIGYIGSMIDHLIVSVKRSYTAHKIVERLGEGETAEEIENSLRIAKKTAAEGKLFAKESADECMVTLRIGHGHCKSMFISAPKGKEKEWDDGVKVLKLLGERLTG